MSTLTLYASSAPVFAKSLTAMRAWLDKAEAHAAAKNFDTSVFCAARLAPDMLPFTAQVHLTTAYAKNAMCRLANQTPPDFAELQPSFEACRARIDETLAIVNGIKEASFAGAEERELNIGVGPGQTMAMNGVVYLLNFLLPNFYFHLTTAYNILRHNGVELGKRDFMGM